MIKQKQIANERSYAKSSSFKMAILFTVLCGLSLFILGYFGYFFARGHFIHGTEEVLDTEIRYLSANQSLDASAVEISAKGRLFIPFNANGDYLEKLSV